MIISHLALFVKCILSVIVHSDKIVLVLNDIKCIYCFPFLVRSDTYRMICWFTLRLHVRQGGARLNQKTGLRRSWANASPLPSLALPPPAICRPRVLRRGGPSAGPHHRHMANVPDDPEFAPKFPFPRNCREHVFSKKFPRRTPQDAEIGPCTNVGWRTVGQSSPNFYLQLKIPNN